MGSGNGLVPSGNKPLPEPMLSSMTLNGGITKDNCVNARNILKKRWT